MTRLLLIILSGMLLAASPVAGFDKDTIKTSAGDLEITFIGHGSLMMKFAGMIIQIDPYSKLTDYRQLHKADIILVTHHHGDHFDLQAIGQIRTEKTLIVLTRTCANDLKDGTVMKNGDTLYVPGVSIVAVPAYNLVHKRPDGTPFHPKGEGNGYVLTFGTTRVYIGGDTENTPDMKALKGIDIAFLPMNLPYTMTPEMVADAARAFRPKILYPYHYGETDPGLLAGLLNDCKDVEIRVRSMK